MLTSIVSLLLHCWRDIKYWSYLGLVFMLLDILVSFWVNLLDIFPLKNCPTGKCGLSKLNFFGGKNVNFNAKFWFSSWKIKMKMFALNYYFQVHWHFSVTIFIQNVSFQSKMFIWTSPNRIFSDFFILWKYWIDWLFALIRDKNKCWNFAMG